MNTEINLFNIDYFLPYVPNTAGSSVAIFWAKFFCFGQYFKKHTGGCGQYRKKKQQFTHIYIISQINVSVDLVHVQHLINIRTIICGSVSLSSQMFSLGIDCVFFKCRSSTSTSCSPSVDRCPLHHHTAEPLYSITVEKCLFFFQPHLQFRVVMASSATEPILTGLETLHWVPLSGSLCSQL